MQLNKEIDLQPLHNSRYAKMGKKSIRGLFMTKTLKFKASPPPSEFFDEVKRKVSLYFKTRRLSAKSDRLSQRKSMLIIFSFLSAYLLLILKCTHFGEVILIYSLLGFMLALGGFNIAHDAAHNAYSSNSSTNYLLSHIFDVGGFSSDIWKITHNQLHHIFTNIDGFDLDITNSPVFRYFPNQKHHPIHRFQHIYAPLIYCLPGLGRLFFFDYRSFHTHRDLIKNKPLLLGKIISCKIAHISLFIVIPILTIPLSFGKILIAYLLCNFIGSIMLAVVVSLAHVNDVVKLEHLEEGATSLNKHWAIHELETTANFGMSNRLLTTLVGGLNFQIEHHLFPHIAHVHYPHIAPIVKQTAEEFGIPYYAIPTFSEALRSHFRLLKKGGEKLKKIPEQAASSAG
jgi:linoleoyl-CoA desaturase